MPPRKARQEPPELPDPVVFGPPAASPPRTAVTGMTRAAPGPAPRARRPRPGPVETSVNRDLRKLPEDLRKGAIAAAVIRLARELDLNLVVGRDAAGHAREIRLAMLTLKELAPAGDKGDQTDEVRERRERRLGLASG